MNKYSISSLFFISILLCSCSDDIEEQNQETIIEREPIVLNAIADSIAFSEAETRAYGQFCYDLLWNENDKIAVVDAAGNHSLFSLIEGKDTPKGTFAQDGEETITGTIKAYYPASLVSAENGNVMLSWPAIQDKATELTEMPLMSSNTLTPGGTRLDFKSLGCILQAYLTTQEPNVILDHITLESQAQALSGSFVVNSNYAVEMTNGSGTIQVNFAAGLELTNKIKSINIYLPPVVNKEITMTFYTKDGRSAIKTFTTTFERNTVKKMQSVINGFGGFELTYTDTEGITQTIQSNTPFETISEEVFKDKDVKSVELPNTVKTLGNSAFQNHVELKSLTLNEGIETLSYGCLVNTGLNNLTIPSTVTTVGPFAFLSNRALQSLRFMSSTPPSFSGNPFEDCKKLNTIYVPTGSANAYYDVLIEVLDLEVDIIEVDGEVNRHLVSNNPNANSGFVGIKPEVVGEPSND